VWRWTAVAVASVVMPLSLAACGNAKAPPVTLPLSTYAITPTPAVASELMAAFRTFKTANHEMLASDQIIASDIIQPTVVGPLIAWDGAVRRYYALANYQLVGHPSYAAQVSFQDGGSYGIFIRSVHGSWSMTGSPGFPICPGIVPAAVASAWHLVNYAACQN